MVALIGIKDPFRKDVGKILTDFNDAGINLIIMTQDSTDAAIYMGKEICVNLNPQEEEKEEEEKEKEEEEKEKEKEEEEEEEEKEEEKEN